MIADGLMVGRGDVIVSAVDVSGPVGLNVGRDCGPSMNVACRVAALGDRAMPMGTGHARAVQHQRRHRREHEARRETTEAGQRTTQEVTSPTKNDSHQERLARR